MSSSTPFKKILVANRAEIALRVMRTARRMGYAAVAIHSVADAGAQHVLLADEAICVGQSEPAESYLNIGRIIEAALLSGADAVHPGYGFLAENAAFARACAQADLVFIGPSAAVIEAMGDKARAKALMRAAGVPCVPGYEDPSAGVDVLLSEACKIGFPIMIKAAAGGGGRGMRVVNEADDFALALAAARSEALASFGDDRVLLEKALSNPRHIEIQVLADRYGQVIHLGERDCSTQRRHQKIIEEAPAPGLDAGLREAMGVIAVRAAQSIGYEGVGTLEFLLDADGSFYFMEMNTRLQVEHCVTEEITGLDLVEQQLRVAAGEPLSLAQEDVCFEGHAIEVRLCAEDTDKDHAPQSGRMAFWQAPELVRVETAMVSGGEVQPFYDSMFAKVIGYGRDRESARRRLHTALGGTTAFGVPTNLTFLRRCLAHPMWIQGGTGTSFLEVCREDLSDSAEDDALFCAMAGQLICHGGQFEGSRLPRRLAVRLLLEDSRNALLHDVQVCWDRNGKCRVEVASQVYEMSVLSVQGPQVRLLLDGCECSVRYLQDDQRHYIQWQGRDVCLIDRSYGASAVAATENELDGILRATTSCKVTSVFLEAGMLVAQGQLLLTTEAMKMEHQHIAPFDAVVSQVPVTAGERVSAGDALVVLSRQHAESSSTIE